MAARTTVYLDEALLARLRRVIAPRGLSRFINEAVADRLEVLERQQIEQAMKEGYSATQDERAAEIDRDWEVVDTEGWPA